MTNLGQGNLGEVAPIDPHRAFQFPGSQLGNEASERPHESRLATAGGPAHEREAARPGGQIDPTQGVHAIPCQFTDVGEGQRFDVNHGKTPK